MGDKRAATPRGRTCPITPGPPRCDGARGRRFAGRWDHGDRGCGVRRHLLPRFLRPAGVAVLTVRCDLDVDILALELYELEVTEPRDDFELEVARAVSAARSGAVGDMGHARALYRRFGIYPTRVRPSSEALFRRLKKGEPLPRVNSLVDVANAVSVELQVPIGLYDLDKTKGDELVVRLGAEGESYTGIRKERVNVAGRICVADAEGPCGNPSADAARTMITTDTERAAWIFFLPVTEEEVDRTAELIAVFGRGLVRMATVPA